MYSDILEEISYKLKVLSQCPSLDNDNFNTLISDIGRISLEIESLYLEIRINILTTKYLSWMHFAKKRLTLNLVQTSLLGELALTLLIVAELTTTILELCRRNDKLDSSDKLNSDEIEELFDKLIKVAYSIEDNPDKTLIFYDIAIALQNAKLNEKSLNLIFTYNESVDLGYNKVGDMHLSGAIVNSLSFIDEKWQFELAISTFNTFGNWSNSKYYLFKRFEPTPFFSKGIFLILS
ncbi:MAG: hypothetical protein IPL26_19160 [Leptospiraceae bacterium]|nr:hypothetical protein [Leptospiraceae bacterium]